MVRVECGTCVVRDWVRSDKDSLLRFAYNRTVWGTLTHTFPHPYTETDAEWWFSFLERVPEPTHWAIEVEGQAVGGIGVILRQGIYSNSAESGYRLAEPDWGRGIVTAAVMAVRSA